MNYLELLELDREPFSNSPDPDAYYPSPMHETALNRLEIAARLHRGLNVVLGMVGTGKSTVARTLARRLEETDKAECRMLLDAGPEEDLAFTRQLTELFGSDSDVPDVRTGMGILQNIVFDRALQQGKTLVLIIDEGQKLSLKAMEILRELLNFETNSEKLLQIFIFAQPEFQASIDAMPNFKDRINELIMLEPLDAEQSAALVRHRLRMAGGPRAEKLFSPGALRLLCKASGGRPRQIVRLAHQCLLTLILANGTKVTAKTVRSQAERAGTPVRSRRLIFALLTAAAVCAACVAVPPLRQQCISLAYGAKALCVQAYDAVFSAAGQPAAKDASAAAPEGQNSPAPKAAVSAASSASAPSAADQASAAQGAAAQPALTEPPAVPNGKADAPAATAKPAEKDQPAAAEKSPKVHDRGPMLGTLHIDSETPAEIAMIVYGTSSAAAAVKEANPAFGKGADIRLPLLEYAVPDKYTKVYLLSFAKFASLQEAFDALPAFAALEPRILPRRQEDGTVVFHIAAKYTFGTPGRAWSWLSSKKTPPQVSASLLAPYKAGERSLALHTK